MFRFNLKVMVATLSARAAAISLVCVIFRPIFPNWAMYTSDFWAAAFPEFSWSVFGILIGLVASSLYGLLSALIFVPLYNFLPPILGINEQ